MTAATAQHTEHNANVDNAEIAKFERAANRWWDAEGEFKPLHQMNPVRANFIDRCAKVAGKQVKGDAERGEEERVGAGGGKRTVRSAKAMMRKPPTIRCPRVPSPVRDGGKGRDVRSSEGNTKCGA